MTIQNHSTAIFVYNDKVIAVACIYKAATEQEPHPPRTIFKTFDKSIQKDDLVVVPSMTRHKRTIVRVVEVGVDVDLESTVMVDWIIAKAPDETEYRQNISNEGEASNRIKAAEKSKKRRELADSLLKDSYGAIEGLGIVTVAPSPAIEDKTKG